jgi:hypothetical protein
LNCNYINHYNNIIEVTAPGIIVKTPEDILNLIFESGAATLIIRKENIDPDFFKLGTGLAGEIFQKFSNYHKRLGIIGDFTNIESKSLKDLIYECNKNREIIFADTLEDALKIFK